MGNTTVTKIVTPEQKKVLDYLTNADKGCGSHNMTDQEFLAHVEKLISGLKLKDRAIKKLGIDLDQVSEIEPVYFEGFKFVSSIAKQTESGLWVSNIVQASWIFFSVDQIFIYTYEMHLDEDKKRENTIEYFYRDVTSFVTNTHDEKTKFVYTRERSGCQSKTQQEKEKVVETTEFRITVPGDTMELAMKDSEDNEERIQGMKQLLREKKNK